MSKEARKGVGMELTLQAVVNYLGGCWDLNLGSLEELLVLLMTEPSLQPLEEDQGKVCDIHLDKKKKKKSEPNERKEEELSECGQRPFWVGVKKEGKSPGCSQASGSSLAGGP